jgi:hypothetical protein
MKFIACHLCLTRILFPSLFFIPYFNEKLKSIDLINNKNIKNQIKNI